MAVIAEWCDCGWSMVRCLTAVMPETGDLCFGRMVADIIEGGAEKRAPVGLEGQWYRTPSGEREGYIFIGPQGQDHHFQASPPAGVDAASLPVLPAAPPGRLWREIEAASAQARALLAGQAVSLNQAKQAPMVCEPEDKPKVAALAAALEAVLRLRPPGVAGELLRNSMVAAMGAVGGDLAAMLHAAGAEIMTLRAGFVIDAPVWSVAMLREEALRQITGPDWSGRAPPVSFKLYNCSGLSGDPERAIFRVISDLAGAGQASVAMAVCDLALSRAEAAKESALEASSVRAHQVALYEAAGQAYAAMRIADVMRNHVKPALWPDDLKPGVLDGYAAQTEEIVVRAGQALGVACINAGSRAAFMRHRAQVALLGEAKADELIEEYWYYPRAAREALLRAG